MGEIKHLNDENFDAETSKGLILADFWAEWCGPCRALSQTIDQIAAETEGKVSVVKVNVGECPELAKRFGIRSIPTIIILKDGEVLRQVGAPLNKANILKSLEL